MDTGVPSLTDAERLQVRGRAAQALREPWVWLGGYLAVLTAIAFWPVPVDRGVGPLLEWIAGLIPWLTYDVIEFAANVVLFLPFGALLTLILRRRRWVLPLALLATVLIEAGQALLLTERTPAISDIVANVLGAAIGMLGVIVVERTRSRRSS